MIRIRSIRLAECRVPLLRPLRLGHSEICTRDFCALRLETEDSVVGEALGYVRGTPLFAALEMLGPRLLGADSLMRRTIIGALDRANIPGRAAYARAISLIDIALWDIGARRARLPLFQILGGDSSSTAVTAVAGYRLAERSFDDVMGEIARRRDEGFARVKIMLDGARREIDQRILERVVSGGIAVAADAHWSWSSLTEAMRYCMPLDSLGLDFLEDPFPANERRATRALQEKLQTPIAAGEDVFGTADMDELARSIGLLRVDATSCGGITAAIEAICVAAAAGRNVLPHVFAPLHVHLACAFPNVEGVEIVPDDADADPIDLLLRERPRLSDGMLEPTRSPGLGISLDWDVIGRFSHRTQSFVLP